MPAPEAEYIARGEPDRQPGLASLALLSHVLDRAFRVPGTQLRFGIDPVMGLVPGLGDMIGSLVGLYSLWIARQMGVPAVVQLRMLLNLAIDGGIGLIPFAGDLFDFAFKAHSRNHALLTTWQQSPHRVQRSSWAVVMLGTLVLLGLMSAAVWVFIRATRWLIAQV